MALLAVRRHAIEQHREWMIHSDIVTFAFVTYRLVERILLDWKVAPEIDLAAFLAFACWLVPLLLAEPLIQWRKIDRR